MKIEVVELEVRRALAEKTLGSSLKLSRSMTKVYGNITNHMKKYQEAPGLNQVPFCKYRNIDWEKMVRPRSYWGRLVGLFKKWEVEVGIPVETNVPADYRFKTVTLNGGRFIRAVHQGPYHKVADTYRQMVKYAKSKRLNLAGFSIEEYTNSPQDVLPEDLTTNVLIPLL